MSNGCGEKRDEDTGLTLIELLIVLVIVVILASIATIIVIRQVGMGKDRAAEAELRTYGMTAYQGFVQQLDRTRLVDLVGEQAKGGVTITYGEGLASTGPAKVVAVLRPADGAEDWSAAVLVRPGRCAVVSATETGGYTPARTLDVASDSMCRAGLGDSLSLVASDFNARTGNPYNGALSVAASWIGNVLQMPAAGMLLSKTSSPSMTNGSLTANVKVGVGSNGAGIVFRGKQESSGALSGFVYQVDPGYPINGRPGLLIRQWVNGSEVSIPMRVPMPTGADPYASNNLRIEVQDNTYTAYFNDKPVGTGPLPQGPSGTQYGARTWTNVPNSPNTIGDFKLTVNN